MEKIFEEIIREMESSPSVEVVEYSSRVKTIELFFPTTSGNSYMIQYNPIKEILLISKNNKNMYQKRSCTGEEFENIIMNVIYPEIYDLYPFCLIKESRSTLWNRKHVYSFYKRSHLDKKPHASYP